MNQVAKFSGESGFGRGVRFDDSEVGCDFSYSEAIDTSTPVGKMTFTVLGAVAELERSLIIERVRAGLKNARMKGSASAGRA